METLDRAFLTTIQICCDIVSLLSIKMPKSRISETRLTMAWLITLHWLMSVWPRHNTADFLLDMENGHWSDQAIRASRLLHWQFTGILSGLYYKVQFQIICIQFTEFTRTEQFHIVNMQQEKKNGPSTLPWTTPLINCRGLDMADPTRTHWVRLSENSSIRLRQLPQIPKWLNLWSNLIWETVSNAIVWRRSTNSKLIW